MERIDAECLPPRDIPVVSVSIVLPVYNCSERIEATLDGISKQGYPSLEVIVVDAGSTDRTLEIIDGYHSLVSRVYGVSDYNIFEMVNKGIALTSGRYIAILFPGSYYLSAHMFHSMNQAVQAHEEPELIYCGSNQHESMRPSRIRHYPVEKEIMEKGIVPVTLPACWIRSDVFEGIGKFNPRFSLLAAYDFYCRFSQQKDLRSVRIDRIYVEYDHGRFAYAKLLRSLGDTWTILNKNFGLWKAFKWFLGINHINILRWYLNILKTRLFHK